MYVTRRRNRVLRKTEQVPLDPAKSNPSKRHRVRLNGELEYLASLLPYDDSVIAKLDKLSILRLAVSYVKAKSYFRALPLANQLQPQSQSQLSQPTVLYNTVSQPMMKAMSGFILVIDASAQVFYASETVEHYLGFHQSDILHQSVLELVHSEDRENLSQQLDWSHINDINALDQAHGHHLLRRSFIVRFRCLLDNTSGFITMEICGHLQHLYGQKHLPSVSLFAVCTPFGPVPIGDFNLEDVTFRTKHKLDMSMVSIDPRGKSLLGDVETNSTRIYNIIHPQDVQYFANGHREMLKTGSAGLVAYRLIGKEGTWLWLQTSARVVYRNSKPDYLMCFHRNLTEDEGSNLLGKRDIEFAMPQIHADSLLYDDYPTEDIPRAPKQKKCRKTGHVQIPVADSVTYDANLLYQKHSMSLPMYSDFQTFAHGEITSVHGYVPPVYPEACFSTATSHHSYERQYYLDYLPHHSNTAFHTVVSPATDKLHQSNTAMTHSSGYSTSGFMNAWTAPSRQNSVSEEYSRMYGNVGSQNQSMATANLLKSDTNSNPLLSYTEMTLPLLNY